MRTKRNYKTCKCWFELFQIVLDVEELTKLHQLAERPRVKEILASEIEKLKNSDTTPKPQTDSNEVQEASAAAAPSSSAPVVVTAAVTKSSVVPAKYYKDITTYGILP